MADLENDELNRQLCAVATDEMFESWSPETQEQILSELLLLFNVIYTR
jgi:hypothetical protein